VSRTCLEVHPLVLSLLLPNVLQESRHVCCSVGLPVDVAVPAEAEAHEHDAGCRATPDHQRAGVTPQHLTLLDERYAIVRNYSVQLNLWQPFYDPTGLHAFITANACVSSHAHEHKELFGNHATPGKGKAVSKPNPHDASKHACAIGTCKNCLFTVAATIPVALHAV
jgi:hypothetical protein